MNTWNEHFSEMDFVCMQDLSAEDTLFNWSLDDFSDIVPKPMAGEGVQRYGNPRPIRPLTARSAP